MKSTLKKRLKEWLPWAPPNSLSRETYRTGIKPLFLVIVVSLGFSFAFTWQVLSILNLVNYGAANMLGALVIALNLEIIPLLIGFIMLSDVGNAFAGEIANVKTSEKIEVLRVSGVDPLEYLVWPRIFSLALMMIPITMISWFASYVGGLCMAFTQHLNVAAFNSSAQDFFKISFLWMGAFKAFVFGLVIGIIGCLSGLSLDERDAGVVGIGKATSRTVKIGYIVLILVNVIFALLGY